MTQICLVSNTCRFQDDGSGAGGAGCWVLTAMRHLVAARWHNVVCRIRKAKEVQRLITCRQAVRFTSDIGLENTLSISVNSNRHSTDAELESNLISR